MSVDAFNYVMKKKYWNIEIWFIPKLSIIVVLFLNKYTGHFLHKSLWYHMNCCPLMVVPLGGVWGVFWEGLALCMFL